MPPAFNGMEMAAPSGKFCMAILTESANAPVSVMELFPDRQPANTTPTAIPLGILRSVTFSP